MEHEIGEGGVNIKHWFQEFKEKYGIYIQIIVILLFIWILFLAVARTEKIKADVVGACEELGYDCTKAAIALNCWVTNSCSNYTTEKDCIQDICRHAVSRFGDIEEINKTLYSVKNEKCIWENNQCIKDYDLKELNVKIENIK